MKFNQIELGLTHNNASKLEVANPENDIYVLKATFTNFEKTDIHYDLFKGNIFRINQPNKLLVSPTNVSISFHQGKTYINYYSGACRTLIEREGHYEKNNLLIPTDDFDGKTIDEILEHVIIRLKSVEGSPIRKTSNLEDVTNSFKVLMV